MNNMLRRNLLEFKQIRNFKELLKVIKETTISDHFKSIKNSIIVSLLFLPLIVFIGIDSKTIERVFKIADLFSSLSIALFGIVFTAYALFQALLSNKLIIEFVKEKSNGKTLFEVYNIFFVKTSLYYLFLILLNNIILLYIENLKFDFYIKIFPNIVNNIIAVVLIYIYFILNIYGIVLIKSVLFNIFQAVNIKAFQITMDEIDKTQKNNKIE